MAREHEVGRQLVDHTRGALAMPRPHQASTLVLVHALPTTARARARPRQGSRGAAETRGGAEAVGGWQPAVHRPTSTHQ